MMDEEAIRSVVHRLSRQHPSGGRVVERAAVMAEGVDSGSILAWIASHDGQPEARSPAKRSGGLHRARLTGDDGGTATPPQRYVLPADALTAAPVPAAAASPAHS
jgi:hypothetical protein